MTVDTKLIARALKNSTVVEVRGSTLEFIKIVNLSDIVRGHFLTVLILFRSTLKETKCDVSTPSVMHQQTLTAGLFTW